MQDTLDSFEIKQDTKWYELAPGRKKNNIIAAKAYEEIKQIYPLKEEL